MYSSSSPAFVFEQVLGYMKNSNLNFIVTETPYSCQVTLKKSFVIKSKSTNQQGFFPNLSVPPPIHETIPNKDPNKNVALEDELKGLRTERDCLLLEVKKVVDDNTTLRDTIEILEGKLEKAESTSYEQNQKNKKSLDDKYEETSLSEKCQNLLLFLLPYTFP